MHPFLSIATKKTWTNILVCVCAHSQTFCMWTRGLPFTRVFNCALSSVTWNTGLSSLWVCLSYLCHLAQRDSQDCSWPDPALIGSAGQIGSLLWLCCFSVEACCENHYGTYSDLLCTWALIVSTHQLTHLVPKELQELSSTYFKKCQRSKWMMLLCFILESSILLCRL